MTGQVDQSLAERAIFKLAKRLGRQRAQDALLAALSQLSNVERAALAARWVFWARSKQLPPSTIWRTWGFLTGRGFGKTFAISKFVNDEVEAGRARLIGLAAQDEANCVALQVLGPSGLIATAPPWFKPTWEASALQLVWPNGARAYVRTPEVPGKIRGLEYDLSWLSELQSWPRATREEAFSNFEFSTRLGLARIVWDATPKRRDPLLKKLLAQHAEAPEKNLIVRGKMVENSANLAQGYVDELIRKYGGTQKGREELDGELLSESETATARQEWIDENRRHMPSRFLRRVLSIDPAVTSRRGSDETGIIEAGLGVDDQLYVLGDFSARHEASAWANLVLDRYVANGCDLILAETNKGGQLVTQNLRAAAKERGLKVEVVSKDEKPSRKPGFVSVKEVYAKGSKEDRAQPLSTAYERKRVSHVLGVDLVSLEDTLTNWEPTPGADSPGDLDALVHAAVELLELSNNTPDASEGFRGIETFARELHSPQKIKPGVPTDLSFVGRGNNSDRI